jgi:hypothetical protein
MSIDDGMGYDSDPKRPWRYHEKIHGDITGKSQVHLIHRKATRHIFRQYDHFDWPSSIFSATKATTPRTSTGSMCILGYYVPYTPDKNTFIYEPRPRLPTSLRFQLPARRSKQRGDRAGTRRERDTAAGEGRERALIFFVCHCRQDSLHSSRKNVSSLPASREKFSLSFVLFSIIGSLGGIYGDAAF